MWNIGRINKWKQHSIKEEINQLKIENKNLRSLNQSLEQDIEFALDMISDDVMEEGDLRRKNARIKLINVLSIIKLKKEVETYKEVYKSELSEYNKGIDAKIDDINLKCEKYQQEIAYLENIKTHLLDEVIDLRQEKMYQEFGLYTPVYDLMSSSLYKDKIMECREKQKSMIRNKTAIICPFNWRVGDSRSEGIKMINRNMKLTLRSFNQECDYLINKVKYHNISSIKEKIIQSFNSINKLNEPLCIVMSEEYLNLKLIELNLCFEYAEQKYKERELLKEKKREERERALLEKEIEEERKRLKKEREHYQTYLRHIEEQLIIEKDSERIKLLNDKKEETNSKLLDIGKAMKDIDYREANQKAGYVYVVSNIGAFGKDVYKIGMTRRLNPQDRIDELSGASVPFKFDVHAMIFSDDAPALEAAIHNALDDKKINLVNNRKEFFRVSLTEIEEIINNNFDRTVDFIEIPDAQQYRESLKIREILF